MKRRNLLFVTLLAGAFVAKQPVMAQAGYVTGDFHQHTTYTDGSYSFGYMMEKNNQYGLDWWANSEHGGAFSRWAIVSGTDLGTSVTWPNTGITALGTKNSSDTTTMWRWQSLRDWSFRDVLLYRKVYPSKVIIQAYEMNVPGHEHASMGCIANQFDSLSPNVNPLSEFEYKFDDNDKDTSAVNSWVKSKLSGHAKAIEAVKWLEANYPTQSWVIPAHPERYKYTGSKGWNIEHFRDLNNAAPDVFFGFESIPGHQKGTKRGEYGSNRPSYGTDTYGGAGLMCARIGGLWDAMLSEGRHFWLFANSDCHDNSDSGSDFYPGQYQKNFTYVSDKTSAQAIVDGLRSGNSYVVMGALIDSLQFNIGTASMGSTYSSSDSIVSIHIRFRDPQTDNTFNTYSSYTNPEVDHFDLIAGIVGSKIDSADAAYTKDTIATTKVIARFGKSSYTDANSLKTEVWTDLGDGWKEVYYNDTIKAGVKKYYRLRGTNLAVNTELETDSVGNPLIDTEDNTATKAFADLWVYTNPVYAENSSAITDIQSTSAQSIKIYPNPSSDVINVVLPEQKTGDVVIYTMNGSTALVSTFNNESEKTISLQGLAKGSYTINAFGVSQVLIVK